MVMKLSKVEEKRKKGEQNAAGVLSAILLYCIVDVFPTERYSCIDKESIPFKVAY